MMFVMMTLTQYNFSYQGKLHFYSIHNIYVMSKYVSIFLKDSSDKGIF